MTKISGYTLDELCGKAMFIKDGEKLVTIGYISGADTKDPDVIRCEVTPWKLILQNEREESNADK